MKQSLLFTKTRREAPKDEVAKNAQLLIRAGFVHKDMAGVYSMLPLGVRVMHNITQIIREEMNAIGGYELHLATLQEKSLWEKTNRWDDAIVDNWFKSTLKNGTEVGLGFTHEEPITALMTNHISSYRDLPRMAYQFQTKFRNEARAKSGVMRGREFLMKDLYSFARSTEEHATLYAAVQAAYVRIFDRIGLGASTVLTFASGGIFSQFSHEFQTISDAGEDTIYVDETKKIAVNKEVLTDAVLTELGLSRDTLVEKKAVEVGNIFSLGTRFSEPLDLMYVDEAGKQQPVVMGSYGIGVGRLMGAIVEVLSDAKGIVWPKAVAPFHIHLVEVAKEGGEAHTEAEKIYAACAARGITVLWDDRDTRAGEKFADADLIGIPFRVVVSEKTIAAGAHELLIRATGETSALTTDQIIAQVQNAE